MVFTMFRHFLAERIALLCHNLMDLDSAQQNTLICTIWECFHIPTCLSLIHTTTNVKNRKEYDFQICICQKFCTIVTYVIVQYKLQPTYPLVAFYQAQMLASSLRLNTAIFQRKKGHLKLFASIHGHIMSQRPTLALVRKP